MPKIIRVPFGASIPIKDMIAIIHLHNDEPESFEKLCGDNLTQQVWSCHVSFCDNVLGFIGDYFTDTVYIVEPEPI